MKNKRWFDSKLLCTNQLIPRRTLGLWYSHIAQLITQAAFLYRSHSSCNYVTQPLGILQRMTNSSQVHIPNFTEKKTLGTEPRFPIWMPYPKVT